MPMRHQPPSLRKATMLVIANHFESICYGVHSTEDHYEMLATDAYLDVEGPFAHMPQPLIEDLAEETKHVTHLRKHHLHMFLTPALTTWAAHGVGDMLTAFPLLIARCQNLKRLDISYLRHINPNILLGLVPRFSSLVSLNLRMTLTVDQMLASIGRNCPQLLDLNLTATPITDRGLVLLCVGEDGQRQAQSLVRLVVAETFVTAAGATIVLQSLARLREFDFDQIFEVLERLESWDAAMEKKLLHGVSVRLSEEAAPAPSYLPLTTLISTAEQVRLSGLDAATRLCPDATSVTLANAWLASEDLYKFMLFERLSSLSLTNSEGLTLDFHDGVLPVLATCGPRLLNLILANFTSVDIAGIGRSCKKLRNIAMSNIAQYESFGPICNEWFTELQALELWSDPQADLNPNMFRQLLLFCPNMQNLLFKGCEVLTDKLFTEITEVNPMKKLSHLTLDHCHAITGDFLHHLLNSENELTVIRLWSCLNITKYTNSELSRRICDENMDVYLEWFQYEE
ncbi:hypothetical protein R5R35_011115 [Gryllus longicercus]|uniref:F-box/leucine rich repeat protein n=2 Tax=Gryllus longicercus TaxID=2509291 RepID=A0AAN9VF06_9ORTH